MVNVQKYQWVAIGDTVKECEKAYVSLLATNGISEVKENSDIFETITGKISAIAPVVIEGNTHYYIALENSDRLFDVNMSDENLIAIIRYQVGDMIELTYSPEENELQTVTQIKRM